MSRSKTWKARKEQERIAAETHRKHPEPMFLFARRQDPFVSRPTLFEKDVKETEVLRLNATLGRIEKAARASAVWNNSDPFDYGRTALHVRKGWIDPESAEKEFRQRSLARAAAKRKEVDDAKASQAT